MTLFWTAIIGAFLLGGISGIYSFLYITRWTLGDVEAELKRKKRYPRGGWWP